MRRSYSAHSARVATFFDGMIVLLLLLPLVTLMTTVPILKSDAPLPPVLRGLLVIGSVIMAVGEVLLLWGTFLEPHLLIVRRRTARLPLPPLKIVIASDLHVGIYNRKPFVRRVVQKINALHPDIVLLPGDFMDDEETQLMDLEPLKDLRSRYGIFAVTGNHDAGAYLHFLTREKYFKKDRTEELRALLTSWGITFFRNEAKTVMIGHKKLVIAGTDDAFMNTCNPAQALEGIDADSPVILLSHTPDVILDPRSHRANLIVSGHTHGGQIRLPVIGPLYGVPDRIGRKYDRGMFCITKTCRLMITGGVGVTGVRARLFCPPEIVLLETGGQRGFEGKEGTEDRR